MLGCRSEQEEGPGPLVGIGWQVSSGRSKNQAKSTFGFHPNYMKIGDDCGGAGKESQQARSGSTPEMHQGIEERITSPSSGQATSDFLLAL
jgi:hypothetical protein